MPPPGLAATAICGCCAAAALTASRAMCARRRGFATIPTFAIMPTGSGLFGICSDVCADRAGGSTEVIMRALVAVISMCASAAAASAQSFSASGQVGYLQEWELKANLARTVSGGRIEYSGPVTLRHVGLCSANGVEEKSGDLRRAVSRWTGGIEGTLAMDGDSCRVVASPSRPYSGLLSCPRRAGRADQFFHRAGGRGRRALAGSGKIAAPWWHRAFGNRATAEAAALGGEGMSGPRIAMRAGSPGERRIISAAELFRWQRHRRAISGGRRCVRAGRAGQRRAARP